MEGSISPVSIWSPWGCRAGSSGEYSSQWELVIPAITDQESIWPSVAKIFLETATPATVLSQIYISNFQGDPRSRHFKSTVLAEITEMLLGLNRTQVISLPE